MNRKAVRSVALLILLAFDGSFVSSGLAEAGRLSSDEGKTSSSQKSSVGIHLNVITSDGEGSIWVGGSLRLQKGLLLRYKNGELTQIDIPDVEVIGDLAFATPEKGWMIADYRNVYLTTDGGKSWSKSLADTYTNFESLNFFDQRNGWVAGWNGIIYHTSDGGTSWAKQRSGTKDKLRQVLFVDGSHGWAMGGKSDSALRWHPTLLVTGNGGESWKEIPSSIPFHKIDFVNEKKGWASDQKNNIYRTTDGGKSWILIRKPDGDFLPDLFFINEQLGWAIGDAVLQTTDGGATWEYKTKEEWGGKIEKAIFLNRLEGWGIGLKDSSHIFHTTDGGSTWSTLPIKSS